MGFGGLYISISGLRASRNSLDTISHNIANSNNPNYVRQSAMHANSPYTKSYDGKLQMGTGVYTSHVRQIRDEYLDLKIRKEAASFGYHYSKSQVLEDIEGVFNEITDSGLQKVMDGFWNNWNELAKEPDSLTIRGLVHESSVAFAETVNHLSTQLQDIKINLNKEVLTKVEETNSILKRIGDYNKAIKLVETDGVKVRANDLRDERNALIDRLSELIPVTSYENKHGETIVHLQGKELVSGDYIATIDVKNYDVDNPDNNGLAHIYYNNTNEKIQLNGLGELGGYIDARDQSINRYMERLDTLVYELATKINELHKDGTDLKGAKGEAFFVGFLDNEVKDVAAFIRVNPLLANYNHIAVSKTGGIGDGGIAKAIYLLRDKKLIDGMGVDEYYRDITLELGLERQESRTIADSQGFLIKSIDEKRRGISAVSLGEEMSEMIKYQHSYTANSRVINAIDEMIETVVNRVGLVGR